jgi:tetratricopeptide (TPR) repeat protein
MTAADTPEDKEQAVPAASSAAGERSVAVGGEVRDSTIITGDSNTIILGSRRSEQGFPWRLVGLIGLPLIAVATAAYVLYPRPTPVMAGDLNVAVAEFGALDAQGAAVESADARALSESLYTTLNDQLQAINQAAASSEQRFDVQVWGPARVGRINGNTPDERATAAEQFALRSRAHVLVYGYLQQRNGGALFAQQFFLRNLPDNPELEGQHDLGRSVPVRSLDDPSSRQQLRESLTGRTHAFAEFVIGLSQYTNDKFADANVHFHAADADPQWDDASGKEVLYLFMGYTAGKLGDLDGARASFRHALTIDPEFARAYLGLGETQFQASLGQPEACSRATANVGGIQDAITLFQRAQSATTQPAHSNVADWSALSLGRAYLCLSQADAGDHWADADRQFRVVIADYEGGNESARDIAAEAHSNLGFVLLPGRCDPAREARYRSAAQEYQRAVDLSVFHPARQAFYDEMIGFVQTQLGALDQARAAYRDAMRVDPANSTRYQEALDSVKPPQPETCP